MFYYPCFIILNKINKINLEGDINTMKNIIEHVHVHTSMKKAATYHHGMHTPMSCLNCHTYQSYLIQTRDIMWPKQHSKYI